MHAVNVSSVLVIVTHWIDTWESTLARKNISVQCVGNHSGTEDIWQSIWKFILVRNCVWSECGMCYSIRSYLNKHMKTHTDEKEYQCSVCEKSFSWSEHRTMHMNSQSVRNLLRMKMAYMKIDKIFSRRLQKIAEDFCWCFNIITVLCSMLCWILILYFKLLWMIWKLPSNEFFQNNTFSNSIAKFIFRKVFR